MLKIEEIDNKDVREIVKSKRFNTVFKHEYEDSQFDWGIVNEDGSIHLWSGTDKPEIVTSKEIFLISEWEMNDDGNLVLLN